MEKQLIAGKVGDALDYELDVSGNKLVLIGNAHHAVAGGILELSSSNRAAVGIRQVMELLASKIHTPGEIDDKIFGYIADYFDPPAAAAPAAPVPGEA